MRYRDFLRTELESVIPQDAPLPNGFHLVGDVVLLKIVDELKPYASDIGEVTMRYDHRIRSVAVRTGGTKGPMRIPDYVVVAGAEDTVTTHVENGVAYRLDPLRITFSGGNRSERIGIAGRVGVDENVVDMFACVGQFSLPIAKFRRSTVTAIEINPDAYDFLVKNIAINRLDGRVTAILGDCRSMHPVGAADTVVMGYLHDTVAYLNEALDCVSRKGGRIHMHQACPAKDSDRIIQRIVDECALHGFSASVETRTIKSYSKGVSHLAFEITLIPMARS